MERFLLQLIDIGSSPLCAAEPRLSIGTAALAGTLAGNLLELLRKKNGFYVFESALHVFPSESVGDEKGLEVWNSPALWMSSYKGLVENCLFFAEDVFGGQFAIRNNQICTFDPETGRIERIANTLDEWAKVILGDFEVLTGYTLAHQWQKVHGPIPSGMRLVPRIPFVLGGEFSLGNVYLVDSIEGMRLRSEIAVQILDAPDGTQIRLQLKDEH